MIINPNKLIANYARNRRLEVLIVSRKVGLKLCRKYFFYNIKKFKNKFNIKLPTIKCEIEKLVKMYKLNANKK